jgi:hypothetical protein
MTKVKPPLLEKRRFDEGRASVETKEMDRLRSEQRQLLRNLPNDVVEPFSNLDAGAEGSRDRLEMLVRRRAAVAAVDPKVTFLLAKLQPYQEARDISNTLVDGMGTQVTGEDARLGLRAVIVEAKNQYREAALI